MCGDSGEPGDRSASIIFVCCMRVLSKISGLLLCDDIVYKLYDEPWLIPRRFSWSYIYAHASVMLLRFRSLCRLSQVDMAYRLNANPLACL